MSYDIPKNNIHYLILKSWFFQSGVPGWYYFKGKNTTDTPGSKAGKDADN